MSERLKILPALIIVAMLAFSVRLVEVVGGVRDISGSAFAAAAQDAVSSSGALAAPSAASTSEEISTDQSVLNDAAVDTNEAIGSSAAVEGRGDVAPAPLSAQDTDIARWRDAGEVHIDTSSVTMEMFKDLGARREALDARERALATREALLQAAEQELERKYEEMEALRTEIQALLEEQSEEEKARTDSLVKIYEGMKPKDAARIFDTLDLDILVNVASGMSERKLSPILAAMNAERAKTLTVMLAEQKTLPTLPQP